MKVFFNNISNANRISFKGTPIQSPKDGGVNSDHFSKKDKIEFYTQKLNNLFPKDELYNITRDMNKRLQIDNPAKVYLTPFSIKKGAGGYDFFSNNILLSLNDIFKTDYKIVKKRNGKKETLIEQTNKTPLFFPKKEAKQLVETARKDGFSDIFMEKTTLLDTKKELVQFLMHEMIHSQQNMLMRQTEGIGEKGIIKAWFQQAPKIKNFDDEVQKAYENSYWATQTPTKQIYPRTSKNGQLAYRWLEDIKNYKKEQTHCAIEADAYNRSYKHILDTMGGY